VYVPSGPHFNHNGILIFQKPIQPLISSTNPLPITDLLSLRPSAYAQKVQNKALNFTPAIQTSTDEAKAVKGRKKNRGDDDARESARREAEGKRREREILGIPTRKKRKRMAVEAGHEIEYVLSLPNSIPTQLGLRRRCHRRLMTSYERVKPLNHLHTVYLSKLLNLPSFPNDGQLTTSLSDLHLGGLGGSTDSLHSKISKADFTGAQLSVASSRNPSLVGITGLVIEETASTFRLVTPSSLVKVIPKNGTQFAIIFPAYGPPLRTPGEEEEEEQRYQSTVLPISPNVMEDYLRKTPRISIPLIGTNFGFRSGDRAGRKFRPTQGGGGGSGWGEKYVVGEWSQTLGLLGEEDGAAGPAGTAKGKKGHSKRSEVGNGVPIKRKRGKSRRKDPPAFGSLETS
jgi:ribonuclease P protein subunit POP4